MKCESKLSDFPGYVVLPDFMNIRQVRAFEDAFFGDLDELKESKKTVFISVSDERMIPFLLGFVLEWHLKGVPDNPTIETIPMTPQARGHALIDWLSRECLALWKGETIVPNV